MNTKYDVMHYINDIRHKIAPAYDGDEVLCQQYAWWILQALCQMTKTELIMQDTVMLSHEQHEQLDLWIHQIVEDKKPLQYILGSVPFADCDILVEPPILIPRPETEEWCLHIIEHLQLLNHKKIKILDIATGSGCIAIALAHHLPLASIVATDISDAALELTEKNIEHHKLLNITCIKSDLFASIPQGMLFDMIVSNPPYISQIEFAHLEKSVVRWEDHNALMADDNGLAIIKQIIVQAPQFIQINEEMKDKNIPQVVIEIGYAQGTAVKNLMEKAGYNNVLVHKDLEGKDRFVTGRVDNVANPCTRT
jgi:release factor glutamine methyltransferase